MKSYNIAVCFSGELRTWEHCVRSIKNFFNTNNHKVTYFLHTWTDSSYPKENIYQRHVHTKEEIKKLKTEYKLSDEQFLIEDKDIIQINLPSQIRFPGIPLAPEFTQKNSANYKVLGVWQHMSNGIMKSNYLKKRFEFSRDMKFDIVVRCRPDTYFNENGMNFEKYLLANGPIYPMCVYGNFHYFRQEFFLPCIDDVFFYGSSRIMDVICDLYRYYSTEKFYEMVDMEWTDPAYSAVGYGVGLYKWITMKNISMVHIPRLEYYIFRNICKGLVGYDNIVRTAKEFNL